MLNAPSPPRVDIDTLTPPGPLALPGLQTRQTFNELLAAGTGPAACGYDCSAKWHEYSNDCADFLGRNHAGLAGFTALCTATHQTMTIYDIDGSLPEHGHDNHFFNAETVISRACYQRCTPCAAADR